LRNGCHLQGVSGLTEEKFSFFFILYAFDKRHARLPFLLDSKVEIEEMADVCNIFKAYYFFKIFNVVLNGLT